MFPIFLLLKHFGGARRAAYQISKDFARRGHEVVVHRSDVNDGSARLDIRSIEMLDGIEVHHLMAFRFRPYKMVFFPPELVLEARRRIRESDIAHLHEKRIVHNVIAHRYLKRHGVPYCLQARGSLPRIIAKQRMRLIFDYLFGQKILHDASVLLALNKLSQVI